MTVDLNKLRSERVYKGITQDDMAKMMGWSSRSAYAKRENGFISIGADELAKIASILGYGREELGIFFKENVPEKERK